MSEKKVYYYRLFTDTTFCGTDETILVTANSPQSIDEEEIRQGLFESYGYLINGWGEEEPTEEECDDFIAECTVEFEEITKEEYEKLLDEGYCVENWG